MVQFDGQVLLEGGEAAEVVGKDHILSGLVLYGRVVLLHV